MQINQDCVFHYCLLIDGTFGCIVLKYISKEYAYYNNDNNNSEHLFTGGYICPIYQITSQTLLM